MKLKFHLFICKACNRFNQQLRLLVDAAQRIRFATENDSAIQLSLDAKARISQIISGSIESKSH
jgi:hypothetical protein